MRPPPHEQIITGSPCRGACRSRARATSGRRCATALGSEARQRGRHQGWTYCHIRQVAAASAKAHEATLDVVNVILSDDLPRRATLDSALIGLQKSGGGMLSLQLERCGTMWLPCAP